MYSDKARGGVMAGEREEISKELEALIELREKLQRQVDSTDRSKAEQRPVIYQQLKERFHDWSEERIQRKLEIELSYFDNEKKLALNEIDYINRDIRNLQKTPQKIYQDAILTIETDVLIPKKLVALESQKSLSGDAIRFTAQGNNVHFIQFVTHQFVDTMEEMPKWEAPARYFTMNPTKPQWRVDAVSEWANNENLPLPFYERHGAHELSPTELKIYDEPGTTVNENERLIFVTFLIKDNQPIYQVRWSRQYNEKGEQFYQIDSPKQIEQLPDWALLVIKEDIYQTNREFPMESEEPYVPLKYRLPASLDRRVDRRSQNTRGFQRSLKDSFLPANQDWGVRSICAHLFEQDNHATFFKFTKYRVPYPSLLKTFGVNEKKVTGPKVAKILDRLHHNNETEKAVALGKQFCDWANVHHRHFNTDEVVSFIKQYETVNANKLTR